MSKTKYQCKQTVCNQYLGKSKEFKAGSQVELRMKVDNQLKIWEKEERQKREKNGKDLEKKKGLKKEETENRKIQNQIEHLENILAAQLKKDIKIDWDKEVNFYQMEEFKFNVPTVLIEERNLIEKEIEILQQERWYEGLFSCLSSKRLKELELKNNQLEIIKQKMIQEERESLEAFNKKENFKCEKLNLIQTIREGYEDCHEKETEEFIKRYFNKLAVFSSDVGEIVVCYDSIQKRLIVECPLPSQSILPRVKSYKYVISKNVFKEIEFSLKEKEELYQKIIYQFVLSMLYIVFEIDYKDNFEMIILNGSASCIDGADGIEKTKNIISVQVLKEDFKQNNLNYVDYKLCLDKYSGRYIGSFFAMNEVTPFATIDKNDSRIIENRDVLDSTTKCNLAQIPWEDFEHLVTNLFKKKYSGKEYSVFPTQQSKDGGVDAIMYYDDAIHGGKYIIQAKRYNNVVPVSSIRELHSTVIAEEALKGIMITTSYYGSESYEFVKDKRITLIDGTQLEKLLADYGYGNYFVKLQSSI